MNLLTALIAFIFTSASSVAMAQSDAAGCKDVTLFNRMPNHYIASCQDSPFELRRFPVGPIAPNGSVKVQEVEGTWRVIAYRPHDSATKPSPLQIQRNFQAAAKQAGATVEGSYPEWCKLELDASFKLGNGCTDHGTTLKFVKDGKESWVFVNATSMGQTGYREGYSVFVLERQAMTQDIVASDLLAALSKDGMIALYLNFETNSAALGAGTSSQLDQIAAMLKATPGLSLEIAGHTDNVGAADANMRLSEGRAAAVAKALSDRGIAAGRLTAKGYGPTAPIADNRTDQGRAKNRRVELVKR